MSNNNKSGSSASGISFCGLLMLAFIVLKLIGKIDWSWWWVLSPAWIPFAVLTAGWILFDVIRFFTKKKYICLFKGHEYEVHSFASPCSYGTGLRWEKKKVCSRCGKRINI